VRENGRRLVKKVMIATKNFQGDFLAVPATDQIPHTFVTASDHMEDLFAEEKDKENMGVFLYRNFKNLKTTENQVFFKKLNFTTENQVF